tara:strand:- start:34742 stop:34933 length:192 start_codon:yes stop_codon:yes gene_type:complete
VDAILPNASAGGGVVEDDSDGKSSGRPIFSVVTGWTWFGGGTKKYCQAVITNIDKNIATRILR